MPLPTGVQYRKAVQNPKINFRDADLARSTAECGANGMPLTYSGGFATTFRMIDDGAEWAVRCFISPVAQLEKRYKIIGRYISQDPPAFLVNAALLANGIQVDAHWHSVIKMEWLGGPTLNAYIETQLQAASKIIKLRDELMELAAAMQARDMAHGDLQHGNIIVSNGRPRLVDYDGIYLPELSGMVPNELGHKHYQHPQRAQQDWGPHMDRFSQIVLHVGLTAIAQRRDLWQKFNNAENVLFKRSDFTDPASSELFSELRRISGTEKMSEDFRALCAGSSRSVPTLQDFVARAASRNGVISHPPTPIVKAGERSGSIRLDATDTASLRSNLGNEVLVCGTISEVHQSRAKDGKPYLFLNVGKYPKRLFVFNIWWQGLDAFDALGQDPTSWAGKSVEVSGVVGIYNNNLQMRIDDPAQIRRIG